jgi:uncharacterized protein (TIGR03435 family)
MTIMGTPRAIALSLILSAGVNAQVAQKDTRTEFDVVSIKPAAPGEFGGRFLFTPGGRLTVANLTLKQLIALAWRIQPYQISGGPPWIDSVRYHISAKPENPPRQDETLLMVQSLLADRFQLTVHHETREVPIYALLVAKWDGKLGPGLTEALERVCAPRDSSLAPIRIEPGKLPELRCGTISASPRLVRGASVSVPVLAETLSEVFGRTVVDKTGLTGNFDIKLEWTPDEVQAMQLPPDVPQPSPSDSTRPSIFTALQEQLGLKVESRKGPGEILVIDRAEKPSEN